MELHEVSTPDPEDANVDLKRVPEEIIRVAVCTPRVHIADPASNCQEVLSLMSIACDRAVDLALFPELCLTGYAIDDLLLQDALLDGAEASLAALLEASRDQQQVNIVGVPVRAGHGLYNCGVAFSRGRLLGVVPKSFLPNYREFYENRYFAPGASVANREVRLAGQLTPFGADLLFRASDVASFTFHVELCEDFWTASPPSSHAALAGALILCNLSASNVVVGKALDRAMLCASQSLRCHAAYLYSAAGPGESTTDLAWDGQATIHQLGSLLGETQRFQYEPQITVADVQVGKLRRGRDQSAVFKASVAAAIGQRKPPFRSVAFRHRPA